MKLGRLAAPSLALAVGMWAWAPVAKTSSAQNAASAETAQLADELFRNRSIDRRGGLDFAMVERDARFGADLTARAMATDTASLAHQEQLTLGIVKWEAWKLQQGPELYYFSFPVFPSNSPLQTLRTRAQALPLAAPTDVDAYGRLVVDAADMLDAIATKLRGQAARKVLMPVGMIDRLVLPYLRPFAAAGAENALAPSLERLAALPPATRVAAAGSLSAAIDSRVVPQAAALIALIEEELRPRAPVAVGLWQYPGGKAAYRKLVQIETSLPDITPEEILRTGERDLKTISGEMTRVRQSLGFRGSKTAFDAQLRKDPRFFARTADEMADRYMAHIRRIEPVIPKFFSQIPDVHYRVERLDPLVEPTATYGSTSGDTYHFNGSQLDQRSMITSAAIIYHELLPGHSYQGAVSRTIRPDDTLPRLRRSVSYPGLSEGWGEYSSSVVAREAGMYADPHDLYGRLGMDAFFAVRLVVDPGMAYFGWSRERAMDLFRKHTLESDVQIESETWRYSTRTPGQVVAYRTGRQVILGLRQQAERELGPRFDVRRFHEAVIASGALPLFLLKEHLRWWIQQEKARR